MESHGAVIDAWDWDTYDIYTMYIALKKLYESGIDYADDISNLHYKSGSLALFFYQLILKIKEDAEIQNKEMEELK